MSLSSPTDLVEGRAYRIVAGDGLGELGLADTVITEVNDSVTTSYSAIRTPTGSYWKTYIELDQADLLDLQT